MMLVVAAVIERSDKRLLIGQRRRTDSSRLKWEFPGGKVQDSETPEIALARELREELGAELVRCVEIGRVQHRYATNGNILQVQFFAAKISAGPLSPKVFEQIAWVLPRELSQYDFLAANAQLVANLATGRIKPGEILAMTDAPGI
jgi:8-oxo-dGTP diphosphatase